MGMAASQARFLGLTARKSNVEYQGQQINQQRTSLANESANLYNQMLELTVPTPPSTTDFYKTTYVLDGSQESYATDCYKIANVAKTYVRENEYKVTLTYNEEKRNGKISSYRANPSVIEAGKGTPIPAEEEGGEATPTDKYTFSFSTVASSGNTFTTKLTYDEGDTDPFKTDDKGQKSLSISNFQLYKLDENTGVEGYEAWYNELSSAEKESAGQCYFYRDKNGNNYFLTETAFDQLKKGEDEQSSDARVAIGTSYVTYKEYSTDVIAEIETSSTGRYSSITISDDDKYSSLLKGSTFTISTTQEMDENAYNDAYNDYEYEKTKYEKAIADINAQTEVIQNEDQQLELRLQQLNTEQNAISTEMDSVSKVIEDNVDKTFKVFA
ncbi:MAG: hypothetical protein IJ877_03305 [Candidatus Gastranaerophilales bacterium]|nr:hypothetical protein [Candidatus Gastranaerophilales bacterium]